MNEPRTAVVLVCHGSRRRETKVEFDQMAVDLAGVIGDAGAVEHVASAYMELAEPSIPTAIESAIERGIDRILVLPWFLNTGRHLAEDVPAIVAGVARAHPDVEITMLPHVGGHAKMVDLLAEIVREGLPDA